MTLSMWRPLSHALRMPTMMYLLVDRLLFLLLGGELLLLYLKWRRPKKRARDAGDAYLGR